MYANVQAKRGLRQGGRLSPLLFVLIIEYLHRTLQKVEENPNFNYHSKCEELRIINLCFVDDLLSFLRENNGSVTMVINVLQDFASTTGQALNPSKCITYFRNVDATKKRYILGLTEFEEGILPFRYHGIPLTSKRLTIHNCMELGENIVYHIKRWISRQLSSTGRMLLIQSIIFSISNFLWEGIEKITFRLFLSVTSYGRMHLIQSIIFRVFLFQSGFSKKSGSCLQILPMGGYW